MLKTKDNTILKFEVNEKPFESKLVVEDTLPTTQLVEIEILPPVDVKDKRKLDIYNRISEIDERLDVISDRVDELNSEIDSLTNHADGIDYAVAVASGVITGLIDSFIIGEFDFAEAKESINKKFNELVIEKARTIEEKEKAQKIDKAIKAYEEKATKNVESISNEKISKIKENINKSYDKKDNSNLSKSIAKLESVFGLPSDSVYVGQDGISAKSHHLDDLAHHPTIIGWTASILTQFTGNTYFQNKKGDNIKYTANKIRVLDNVNAYIAYGNTRVIEKITKTKKTKQALEVMLIGDDFKSKLACGTLNWLGHLLSDMAGSSSSAKKGNVGMGLPGPILSILKEFAMLPMIKKTTMPQILNDLFTKDNAIFGNYRLDLRSELAIGSELCKQSIPVFLNTLLVRTFFFMRKFVEEAKMTNSINNINWKNTLPFKNRTVARMLTISTSTFMAIDIADAAIRSGGFDSTCILRINFAGIGRFAVAIGADVRMGINKNKKENEKIKLTIEQLELLNAKLFYKEADMWIEAEKTDDAIKEVYAIMENAAMVFDDVWMKIEDSSPQRRKYIDNIRKKDTVFTDELSELIEWGN